MKSVPMMKSKNLFVICTFLFLVFGLVYVFSYILSRDIPQNEATHWEEMGKRDANALKYSSAKDKKTAHAYPWESDNTKGWKPGIKYKMVDIKELHVGSETRPKKKTMRSYKILHYNPELKPFNFAIDNKVIKNECSYTNCEFSSDVGQMVHSDAVIFHLPKDGSKFTTKPPGRALDQVWILSDIGPHGPKDLDIPQIDAKWRNKINWTMSYRFDSDILWTYGTLKARHPDEFPNKDYYTIASHRQKSMTLITNCYEYERNGLKQYIKLVQSHIYMDVYGECKGLKPLHDDLRTVVQDYFYFFLFEETFCPNFFSEIFFNYFDLDVVLVLRRGSDYLNMVPNDIFINMADYSTLKSVMSFLNSMGPIEVVEYIRRKDAFVTAPPVRWQCDLCHKLNHKRDNRRVYKSLAPVLESSVCAERKIQWETRKPTVGMQLLILVGVFMFMVFMFRNYNCRCYWFEDPASEKEHFPNHT